MDVFGDYKQKTPIYKQISFVSIGRHFSSELKILPHYKKYAVFSPLRRVFPHLTRGKMDKEVGIEACLSPCLADWDSKLNVCNSGENRVENPALMCQRVVEKVTSSINYYSQ
jgi:hypothetical protein